MQVRCKNCIHDSWKTRKDIDTCYDCENFSSFSPKNRKVGRPYHVRVSELRYGEVTVWAASEEEAKTVASGAKINFFDSEITDVTVEGMSLGDCPLGGDTENDCADCAYSGDFHFKNGECVSRKEDKENEQV